MMKLYSAWYCPFAQRAWLALIHKALDFETIEIDPYDKNEQWLGISRQTGMVPVVVQPVAGATDLTVVDSNRIIEFVDNAYPQNPRLLSVDANEQAEQKYWMDFVGRQIIPYFYRFLKCQDAGSQQDEMRDTMLVGLDNFTQAMSDKGPFFSGQSFGAVDIAFIPFAYRINILLHYYRDFKLPTEGVVWQRYQQWFNAVVALPTFQQTVATPANYDEQLISFYLPYSHGGGQKDVTAL